MLGMLFGSFFIGQISDRYGRMPALMLGLILVYKSIIFFKIFPYSGFLCYCPKKRSMNFKKNLMLQVSGSGFLGAFMNDMHGYGFFRFLTGIGGIACFMVTFVICVEYVGVKYTMLTGIAIEIPLKHIWLETGLPFKSVRCMPIKNMTSLFLILASIAPIT